jgi:hypothetical protein
MNVDGSVVERSSDIAWTLLQDHLTVRAFDALRRAGHDPVLLKGASTARWLYPGEVRRSVDIDLYIDPDRIDEAMNTLVEAGWTDEYRHWAGIERRVMRTIDATCDGMLFELHRTFHAIGVAAPTAWQVLRDHRSDVVIGTVRVPCLDEVGRALFIALHAHTGDSERKNEDLRRAIGALAPEQWQHVAELAERLGALDALAAGLQLVPEGAGPLQYVSVANARAFTRLHQTHPHAHSFHLAELMEMHGKDRWHLALRRVFPSRGRIRTLYPDTAATTRGLVATYARRYVDAVVHLVPTLRAVKKAGF